MDHSRWCYFGPRKRRTITSVKRPKHPGPTSDHGRFPAAIRGKFQVVIALILIICLLCPFVELALGWDSNIFMTGHDAESTLAVVILLFELVVALTNCLAFLLPNIQIGERIVEVYRRLMPNSDFHITIPDSSPPVPLRI